MDQALAAWPPSALKISGRDARQCDGEWLILLENYPETFDWTLQTAPGMAAQVRIGSGRTIYWGWDAQRGTVILAGMFSNDTFYFWSYRNPGSKLETVAMNLPLYFDYSDHRDGRITLKKQFHALLTK